MINQSSLKDFDIILKLGQGSFGIVYKVKRKIDNNIYVLKQINISKMNKAMKADAINEVTILSKLNHPNIVKYHDSFIDKNFLNIIMEYCSGGDLSYVLKNQLGRPLQENKIWNYFIQMCLGIEYIHKKKILHRDIKTMNVFLDQDNQVRIGDLGVAKVLQENNDFARTMIGTPFYLSPEMCEEKPYNDKSDVWALGCVLYELCTFKHPFEAKTQAALILKIIRGKYDPISSIYSKELEDLVECCLRRDYRSRPNVAGILQKQSIIQKAKEININLNCQIDNRPQNYIQKHEQPVTNQASKDKDMKNSVSNKQLIVQKNEQNSKISKIQQQIIKEKPEVVQKKNQADKIEKKPEIAQVDKILKPEIVKKNYSVHQIEQKPEIAQLDKQMKQKIETPKIQQKQINNNIFNDQKQIQNPNNDKLIGAQKKEIMQKVQKQDPEIQKQPEKEQPIIKIKSSAFDNKPVFAFEGKPPSAKKVDQTPQQVNKKQIQNQQQLKPIQPQEKQQVNPDSKKDQQQQQIYPQEKQQVNPASKKDKQQQSISHQQVQQQQQKNKEIKQQQVVQNKSEQVLIKKSNNQEQNADKREIQKNQQKNMGGVNMKPLKKPQLFGLEKQKDKKQDLNKKMKELQAQKKQFQQEIESYSYDKQEQDMILNLPDVVPKKLPNKQIQSNQNSSSSSIEIQFEQILNPFSLDPKAINLEQQNYDNYGQQQIVDEQFIKDEFASDEEVSTTNQSELVKEGNKKQVQQSFQQQSQNENLDFKQTIDLNLKNDHIDQDSKIQQKEHFEIQNNIDDNNQVIESESDTPYQEENSDSDQQHYEYDEPEQQDYIHQVEDQIIENSGEDEDIIEVVEPENVDMGEDEDAEHDQQMDNKQSVTSYVEELQKKLYEQIQREKELKSLLDLKHQDCVNQLDSQKFNDILCFFRKKLNSDQELTSEDQDEIDKIIQQHMINHHNPQIIYTIYKILHLEIELEKTKEKIQGLVNKLDHLSIEQSQIQ